MKKIKIIVGAVLRGALLIAPGVAFGWWAWSKAMALIAILAAVGVEAVYLFVFALIAVAVQAAKDRKKASSILTDDMEDDEKSRL